MRRISFRAWINKELKRAAALLISATMLLSGCGSSAENPSINWEPVDGSGEQRLELPTGENGVWQGEGGCYKLEVPDINRESLRLEVVGEDLFTTVSKDKRSLGTIKVNLCYSLRHNNKEIYESSGYNYIAVSADSIWILENITDYKVSNDRIYSLKELDWEGNITGEAEVMQHLKGSDVADMKCDRQGRLYIRLDQGVLVYEADGSFICRIEEQEEEQEEENNDTEEVMLMVASSDYGSLLLGGDGNVYALSGNREQAYRLDLQNKTMEPAAAYPEYYILGGTADYLFLLANETGLYGLTEAGGNVSPLVIWAECGIRMNEIYNIWAMEDGRFLLKNQDGYSVMRPAQPTEITDKVILTMAGITNYEYSRSNEMVANFNYYNNDYSIEYLDYSQGGQLSTDEAIAAFNQDLLTGTYPDLFDFYSLPESYYTDKGLVTDLKALLDQDSELNWEDFPILARMMKDDKLYYATDRYVIGTQVGLYSRFGDNYSLTLDDYRKLQNEYNGTNLGNYGREYFLRMLVEQYTISAVDWENKTCDFTDDNFLKILEISAKVREIPENEIPLEYTPSGPLLKRGELIFSDISAGSLWDIASMRVETGERLSYVGMPSPDGKTGSTIYPQNLIGICAQGNQQGAWAFIKYMLTREIPPHSKAALSVNRRIMQEQMDSDIREAEDGGNEQITEDDVNQLMALIEDAVFVGTASERIMNIVMEEAAAYFAGGKTAEETAKVIQSRVSVLVAE